MLCSLRAHAGAPNYHIHRTHAGERASRPHYKGFIYQKTNYSHAYPIKRREKIFSTTYKENKFFLLCSSLLSPLAGGPHNIAPKLLRECELLSFVVYLCDYFAYRHSRETSELKQKVGGDEGRDTSQHRKFVSHENGSRETKFYFE